MFLNFPVMDMNRNAIWRNPDKVPKDGIERMKRFWGDEFLAAGQPMAERPQPDLFGPAVKQTNDAIVAAFRND